MLVLDHSRGDTIIEALFAITVFSLVVVGSLSIMNQGSATAQRSLEISLVRNEIDAQAEALRFLNASYVAAYQPGVSTSSSNPFSDGPAHNWWEIDHNVTALTFSDFGTCYPSSSSAIPINSYIINTKNAALSKISDTNWIGAMTYAQVRYNSTNPTTIDKTEGIWIEAVKTSFLNNTNNQKNAGYIDFHIRACWDSPGQSVPMTLGTIVRLYEPIN